MNLDIHRGLIIVYPYGTLIKKKTKTLIVKTKNIASIIDSPLLLIENKLGLGIIKLSAPKQINLQKFDSLHAKHQISTADRLKWWPKYHTLYAYKITKTKFFKQPILLDYKLGPQITVTKPNIILKHLLIGMSGYFYFYMYPKSVKDILAYYTDRFNAVEINATFYNFPKESLIATISKTNLMYSIKVNRYITHQKKLHNVKRYWKDFLNQFTTVRNKILCFLFQLPPSFHFTPENYTRLKALSTTLKKNPHHYYAFEFRHESWFLNDKVNRLFKKNAWVFVISNVYNSWVATLPDGYNPPLQKYVMTTDMVYLRMHGTEGKYKGSYSNGELKEIINFISNKQVKYACVFFNNTDDSSSIKDAQRLTAKVNPVNML